MHLTLELLNASTLCTLTGVSGNKRIHTTGFVTSYAKRIITALREIIHSNRIRTLTTSAAPIFAYFSDNIQQLINRVFYEVVSKSTVYIKWYPQFLSESCHF